MLKKWLFLPLFTLYLSTAFANNAPIKATLLAEITEQGQKVVGVALEYEKDILLGSNLKKLYRVETQLDQADKQPRTRLNAYVNDQPQKSANRQGKAGRFVIIELDPNDENASLYSLQKANTHPITVRERQANGEIIEVSKTQLSRVPNYYEERLIYHIEQTGLLTLVDNKQIDPWSLAQPAVKPNVRTAYLDQFTSDQVVLNDPQNILNYRLYQPAKEPNKRYPLTIFLHGSGQVGTDNLAHLLSSKGAISTLAYEEGFVLAPQYHTIFDPFDDVQKGQRGGIHWQTENRRHLLLAMIDKTLQKYPQIDRSRIYLVGLSRGAEGALYLLLDRPNFFAAALLMSGREAYSLEWIDGNATPTNLASLRHTPIWFFHSLQDTISPVKGSRINYQLLANEVGNTQVKYTELNFLQAGDNGIINNNAHNSWDMVFNSPYIHQWLLAQQRKQE